MVGEMMDGRRHSVDIPITRTLVALRRVRSLRDPSTNSMTKFSGPLDNINWEMGSNNDVSLRFMSSPHEGGSDKHRFLRRRNLGLYGQREGCLDDFDLDGGLERSRMILHENSEWIGSREGRHVGRQKAEDFDCSGSEKEEVYGNKSLSDRYCSSSQMEKQLVLSRVNPVCNPLEDVDYKATLRTPHLGRADQSGPKRKPQRRKNHVNSFGAAGDGRSLVGSPCPSASDALSSNGTSLFGNEEAVAERNHRGCGVSCCWSQTPRFSRDVDDHPLLYKNADEFAPYEQRGLKDVGDESYTQSENPRSLSQKFRPKSFTELVGQNVVARSLLGAISRGRVTSLYLFHGPRGTGKTSASRIFAAALNCLSREEHRPCGICSECVLFFSGRSRDIREVDSVRINRRDRVRSLIKNAGLPPVSSRFKVFIVDECHLMRGETWATVLSSIDNLSQHVVFVMITPDIDNLPRNAVSRSQRYHFPKIKDADIARRLGKICVEEGLEFDQVALDFIAAKSNGSLRDAEMMLDQLSLLGKRITTDMAYELIGVVSDDELLDLLDLALSSDTPSTVIRARELMRSRIDPMQLISQLANLVMDILAGKCQDGASEVREKFYSRHTSEVDLQKLSIALRIFSETEKQLRVSKNQTTWLTAALLQLSSMVSSSFDSDDSKFCLRNMQEKGENFRNVVSGSCNVNIPDKLRMQKDSGRKLESIWKRATDLCPSNSLKTFLKKHGKLSSLLVSQGFAIAELEFYHPDYASKAEKSWKIIASSLQSLCGCNVEIRINLVSDSNYAKVKKLSFRLFSCSRRMQQKSQSSTGRGSDSSDYSEHTSEKPILSDKPVIPWSSDAPCQMPHNCCDRMVVVSTLRNSEGNILSTRAAQSRRSYEDDTSTAPGLVVDSSKEERSNHECQDLSFEEPEYRPYCFPRTMRRQKKSRPSDASQMTCCTHLQNKFAPSRTSFETCLVGNDSYVFCSGYCNNIDICKDENALKENSGVLCWKTPTLPLGKAWQSRHQRQSSDRGCWALPCANAK